MNPQTSNNRSVFLLCLLALGVVVGHCFWDLTLSGGLVIGGTQSCSQSAARSVLGSSMCLPLLTLHFLICKIK